MEVPAPLTYPRRLANARLGQAAPYTTEAGFVVLEALPRCGKQADTMVVPGEVAEWLKAAPC
jgi:hypothetical protein